MFSRRLRCRASFPPRTASGSFDGTAGPAHRLAPHRVRGPALPRAHPSPGPAADACPRRGAPALPFAAPGLPVARVPAGPAPLRQGLPEHRGTGRASRDGGSRARQPTQQRTSTRPSAPSRIAKDGERSGCAGHRASQRPLPSGRACTRSAKAAAVIARPLAARRACALRTSAR